MNKKPVSYLQTDAKWKDKPYRTNGESSTIGSAGCGPTCAAMVIATVANKKVTPVETSKWSMKHGYKALNQGTYYSYFKAQFAEYGITCAQLNTANLYGKSSADTHKQAFDLLKQGYYIIACMGKGNWTSSGHFVLVWWEDGKVRINDPASTRDDRVNGDLSLFKSQVKYYWSVDVREYNNEKKGGGEVTQEQFNTMMEVYEAERAKKKVSSWAADAWQKVTAAKIMDGTKPRSPITRQELAIVLQRLGLIK